MKSDKVREEIAEVLRTTPIAGDFDRTRAIYANEAVIDKILNLFPPTLSVEELEEKIKLVLLPKTEIFLNCAKDCQRHNCWSGMDTLLSFTSEDLAHALATKLKPEGLNEDSIKDELNMTFLNSKLKESCITGCSFYCSWQELVNNISHSLATKLKGEEKKFGNFELEDSGKPEKKSNCEYGLDNCSICKPQLSAEEKESIQNSLCETCLIVRDCKVRFSTMGIISECAIYKPVCGCGKPEPLKMIEELRLGINKLYYDQVVDKINEIINQLNQTK